MTASCGNGAARPNTYTKEIGAEIFARLMEREILVASASFHRLCADPDMPTVATAAKWLAEEKHFAKLCEDARTFLLNEFTDELIKIVEDSADDWIEKVNRRGEVVTVLNRRNIAISRLRLDVRCWVADQLWPENEVKFGKRTRQPKKELSQ